MFKVRSLIKETGPGLDDAGLPQASQLSPSRPSLALLPSPNLRPCLHFHCLPCPALTSSSLLSHSSVVIFPFQHPSAQRRGKRRQSTRGREREEEAGRQADILSYPTILLSALRSHPVSSVVRLLSDGARFRLGPSCRAGARAVPGGPASRGGGEWQCAAGVEDALRGARCRPCVSAQPDNFGGRGSADDRGEAAGVHRAGGP